MKSIRPSNDAYGECRKHFFDRCECHVQSTPFMLHFHVVFQGFFCVVKVNSIEKRIIFDGIRMDFFSFSELATQPIDIIETYTYSNSYSRSTRHIHFNTILMIIDMKRL